MNRALPLLALVASLPAWAVGEHIAVTGPAREQLSETLCISMECGKSGDYTVSSKVVGGKMELKVLGPSGPRFSLSLPLTGDGRLANSDAMTATSQLVQAIESPASVKQPAAEKAKVAKKSGKAGKYSKLAKASKKGKLAKPVRVAARKLSRG